MMQPADQSKSIDNAAEFRRIVKKIREAYRDGKGVNLSRWELVTLVDTDHAFWTMINEVE